MQDCFPGTSSVSPKWSVTMLDCLPGTATQELHQDDVENRRIELPDYLNDTETEPEGIVTMQDSLPEHPLDR